MRDCVLCLDRNANLCGIILGNVTKCCEKIAKNSGSTILPPVRHDCDRGRAKNAARKKEAAPQECGSGPSSLLLLMPWNAFSRAPVKRKKELSFAQTRDSSYLYLKLSITKIPAAKVRLNSLTGIRQYRPLIARYYSLFTISRKVKRGLSPAGKTGAVPCKG